MYYKTMTEPLIHVDNLSKIYKLYDNPLDRLKESLHPFRKKYHRDFYALNNINFEVNKGESIGIIGKNGSGKSTLLKILTGVLTPTSGSTWVNGKVSSLLELGAGFNPEMTGIENVYFNGTIMGFSKQEMDEKIGDVFAFADIGDFVYQPVKTYSSGMFVRLAFASAISVEPDILIIDEALSVGDIYFQQKCHARMEELINRGTTVIVVSHDMTSVEKYSDRVLLLDHGYCLFMGHPNEAVYRYYALLNDRPKPSGQDSREATVISHEVPAKEPGVIKDWPPGHAFLDLSNALTIGIDNMVKCTGIAVCNEAGQPCTSFETEETAYFYYEFEALQDLDVPIGGVEIVNSNNIVLHAKSSMHYLLQFPPIVRAGNKIRYRQSMQLSLTHGEYTFLITFATMKEAHYIHAEEMRAHMLHSKIDPILRVTRVGTIFITEKSHGLSLPFYGYVDLKGDMACELL